MNKRIGKRFFVLIAIGIVTTLSLSRSFAQSLVLQTLCSLDSFAVETSGIEKADSTSFWTHNDSGGNPVLYHFNSSGQLLDTVIISNANNIDWEDLARDDSGNIYIGDFGNNFNDRTNLRILKLNHDSLQNNNGSIAAEIISFTYPDQTAFPPATSNLNFDCEAFIHSGDSLYLFTKNVSTSNNNGYSKLYRLPDDAGNYSAELLDSFHFAEPVTSADINANDSTLIVLTYYSIFQFKGFQQHNFFSVTPNHFTFPSLTQKEAVLIKDSMYVYITDEKAFGIGGKLYLTDLSSGVKDVSCLKKNFSIYPNPSNGQFFLSSTAWTGKKIYASIFDESGREIKSETISQLPATISTEMMIPGIYFLKIKTESANQYSSVIIQR